MIDLHAAGVQTAEAATASPTIGSFPAAVFAAGEFAQGPSGSAISYVVGRGDNVRRVSSKFNVSVDSITSLNPGIGRSGSLRVGQTIKILTVPGTLYRVAPGESADKIAANYGVGISALQAANPSLNLNNLGTGNLITVPTVSASR